MYEYGYIKHQKEERASFITRLVAWIITIAIIAYAVGVLLSIKTPESNKVDSIKSIKFANYA